MSYEFEGFAPQGWQCPICKRVYSPMTPTCWYCGNYTTTTSIEIHSSQNDLVKKWNEIVNSWNGSDTDESKD